MINTQTKLCLFSRERKRQTADFTVMDYMKDFDKSILYPPRVYNFTSGDLCQR